MVVTLPGPLLFARYAFMPNQLGYCGSDDNAALFEYSTTGVVDGGLVQLEQQFEGAYPYLQLIARANGIADPLDSRVVEAYWTGNGLLDRIDLGLLAASLQERFAGRMTAKAWPWLAAKVPAGARPHHSFHVFEIYPRIGTMKGGIERQILETIEQCRIGWGIVRSVDGPELTVQTRSLVYRDGQLSLGEPHPRVIRRQFEGRGFVDDAAPGDVVSIHWGWACERLDRSRAAQLARYTRRHLALCNETL